MLSHYEGWGMRIVFVSEDQLCNPPAPEIRKSPKRIPKKVVEELARIAKEWHPSKNKTLKPAMVTAMSHRRVWWRCSNDPAHEWQAIISNRTSKGQGCPLENLLSDHHPEIAAQWHPTRNGKLKPSDLTRACDDEVWWICQKKHAWRTSVYNRTVLNRQCSICKTLKVRYPAVAKRWHPSRNGKLTPLDVKAGSGRVVWWKCIEGHVWTAAISAVVFCFRTYGTSGCRKCFEKQRADSARTLKGRSAAIRRQLIIELEKANEDDHLSRPSTGLL